MPKNHPKIKLRIRFDETFTCGTEKRDLIATQFGVITKDVTTLLDILFSGLLTEELKITCTANPVLPPHVDAITDPDNIVISLQLSLDDLKAYDYCRFVYQLGHELGHVVMGPLRTNGLIETLADAISYEILNRMTYLWRLKYKVNNDKNHFAPEFQKYRIKVEQKFLRDLPKEIKDAVNAKSWTIVAIYLKTKLQELEANLTNHKGLVLRSVSAMVLRAGKVPWKDLAGIRAWTDQSIGIDKNFRSDIQIDTAMLSTSLQKALLQIGR